VNVSQDSRGLQYSWTLDKERTDPHEAFFYLELVCNAWFTFELAVRSVVSQVPCTQCRKLRLTVVQYLTHNIIKVLNFLYKEVDQILYSICYGNECASSSVTDVDDFVIIIKLLGSIFDIHTIFIS
jgi:hypothetical protein